MIASGGGGATTVVAGGGVYVKTTCVGWGNAKTAVGGGRDDTTAIGFSAAIEVLASDIFIDVTGGIKGPGRWGQAG